MMFSFFLCLLNPKLYKEGTSVTYRVNQEEGPNREILLRRLWHIQAITIDQSTLHNSNECSYVHYFNSYYPRITPLPPLPLGHNFYPSTFSADDRMPSLNPPVSPFAPPCQIKMWKIQRKVINRSSRSPFLRPHFNQRVICPRGMIPAKIWYRY